MNYTKEEQKQHRQDWVKALRSGDYQQAQGTLRKGDSFCCLGVACDISGVDEWRKVETNDGTFYYEYLVGNWQSLAVEIADYYGMRDGFGGFWIDPGNKISSLSTLNDRGLSFDEIANIIEKEPEGLFTDDVH